MNVLPHLSTAMVLLDTDGRVTEVQGNSKGVLGKLPDQLKGLSLSEILETTAPLDLGAPEPTFFVRGGRNGKPIHFRVQLTELDGGRRAAEISDLAQLLEGAPPLQISRLSSSLSHELRNPLSSVKMAVQTLMRNPGHSAKDLRRLDIANREIRTLERMLALLSEYGRDVSNRIEAMPLLPLLREVETGIDLELQHRGVRLEIVAPEGLPRVKVDAARTRPVLAQFILNLVAANDPSRPLTLTLSPVDGGVQLTVLDEGAPITEAEATTLFEPFGSRLAHSSGLSLAALRRVLRAQGGQATAASEGTGTLFTLTFAPETAVA